MDADRIAEVIPSRPVCIHLLESSAQGFGKENGIEPGRTYTIGRAAPDNAQDLQAEPNNIVLGNRDVSRNHGRFAAVVRDGRHYLRLINMSNSSATMIGGLYLGEVEAGGEVELENGKYTAMMFGNHLVYVRLNRGEIRIYRGVYPAEREYSRKKAVPLMPPRAPVT